MIIQHHQIFPEEQHKSFHIIPLQRGIQQLRQRNPRNIFQFDIGVRSLLHQFTAVDPQLPASVAVFQFPVGHIDIPNMLVRFRTQRILSHRQNLGKIVLLLRRHSFPGFHSRQTHRQDLRPNPVFTLSVVGIFHITDVRLPPDHRQERIGVHREQPFPQNAVKSFFLVKENHPVPVKVAHVVGEFARLRQVFIRIESSHKLVVWVRIIETVILYPAVRKNILQSVSRKSAHYAAVRITFDPGKTGAKMILTAPRPVFQTKPVLDRDDNAPILFQMIADNIQKILERRLPSDVGLCILQHTDETDIVVVAGQRRFDVLKISHMYRNVPAVHMPIRIDHASLFGQFDTGDFPRFFRKNTCYCSAAGPDLQHFHALIHRQPLHDILPLGGQMIQYFPAFPLLDHAGILRFGVIPGNLQQVILHRPIAVHIVAGVIC